MLYRDKEEIHNEIVNYGPRDRGSIPSRVIPKTQIDVALLSTQNYKVRIKSKVEQSWK